MEMERQHRPVPQPKEFYRHNKTGNVYEIDKLVKHTETGEILVAYKLPNSTKMPYARPLDMFMGYVEIDGQTVPRFEKVAIGKAVNQ